MYAFDIAQLVRSALEDNGCDPSIISDIDSHSTIVLDLYELPSIHISVQSDDVWIWAELGEYNDAVLNQRAASLLKSLLEGCQFSRCRQYQLGIQDGSLLLELLVHSDYLRDGSTFSEALNGFYGQLEHFYRSLLR